MSKKAGKVIKFKKKKTAKRPFRSSKLGKLIKLKIKVKRKPISYEYWVIATYPLKDESRELNRLIRSAGRHKTSSFRDTHNREKEIIFEDIKSPNVVQAIVTKLRAIRKTKIKKLRISVQKFREDEF